MDSQAVIDATRRWISAIVIGLDLCPFARRVFETDKIRYVVSAAKEERDLFEQLSDEAQLLASTPLANLETTLLIHPYAYSEFLEYNDFLDVAERRIKDLGLDGILQIASFHPQYQFADTDPDAVENYTNRSPFPMLHLLREESVTAIAGDAKELLEIPRRNIEMLRSLGRDKILAKLKSLSD